MNAHATIRRTWLLLFFWGIAAAANANASDTPPQRRPHGRHALLVGCTRYANLAESYQLRGPANDVVLTRQVLMGRFGFPAEAITTLSEAAGENNRPTRANIQREFRRLAQRAREGDQVVILLAGHGSQQPGRAAADDPDAGRLHKIFLPADVGKWDDAQATVANAILDDDFHDWLQEIRKTGAYVWVIVDACHSGGLIRGAGDEVVRQVPPGVLVPEEVMRRAERLAAGRPERTRGAAAEDAGLRLSPEERAVVAVYAAQGSEVTVEKTLPPDSGDGKRYGLFSYTLNQVLMQSAAALTYAELIQQVQSQYTQWGRSFPTPLVQGKDRDREVLGTRDWPGRSHIVLQESDDGLAITAGALQGLTTSSILAVYPPPGQKHGVGVPALAGKRPLKPELQRGAAPLGYVRIAQCRTLDSLVQPCAYGGRPASKTPLPEGGVCELVAVDHGDLRLRVAIDRMDDAGRGVREADRHRLQADLTIAAAQSDALFRFAEDPAGADWLVRRNSNGTYLIPATGLSGPAAGKLAPLFGPATSPLPDWLGSRLNRIARAQNLKRLASSADETLRGSGAVQVGVELRLLRDKADRSGSLVRFDSHTPVFRDGDRLAIRLRNPNRFPADVTLLYVDSGFGIESMFPHEGEINRLGPSESRVLHVRVTTKTVGQEHLAVIAVRGTAGQPADFSILAQPTLERQRGAGPDAASRGPDSPLRNLLEHALYAQGATRSMSAERDVIDTYSMRLLSWQIKPREE